MPAELTLAEEEIEDAPSWMRIPSADTETFADGDDAPITTLIASAVAVADADG
jgi:hypothetical protein